MKTKHFFPFLALLLMLTGGCKKDNIENDLSDLSKKYNLSEIEKEFFDLGNSGSNLTGQSLSGRSGVPGALMNVYRDLLETNDANDYVTAVVERIGFPLWTQATVDLSADSSNYLVHIPFAKPGIKTVQAILTGLMHGEDGDVRYEVRSRKDLEDVLAGTAPMFPGICRACTEFGAFDHSIFGVDDEAMNDLTCEACFPGEGGGNFQPNGGESISERSCETVNITYCIFDEPNGPIAGQVPTFPSGGGTASDGWYNPEGGSPYGWGGISGGFVFVSPNYPSSGPVGSGGGGGFSLGWLNDFIGSLGNFIGNLVSGPVSCYKFKFQDPDDGIADRDGEIVYVCQTFTSILCSNSNGWWEVVESWPCPDCDGNVTLEEWHAKLCQESTLEFLDEYGISGGVWRQYAGSADCCTEGVFDAECGLRALFEGVGLNEDEINTIIDLGVEDEMLSFLSKNGFNSDAKQGAKNIALYLREKLEACNFTCEEEAKEDLAFILADPFIEAPSSATIEEQDYGDCFVFGNANSNGTHTITVYVDQPVANSTKPWEPLTNVGHAFIGMQQTINGVTKNLIFGHYPEPGTGGTPWKPNAEGLIRHDEVHEYDVSITVSIQPWEFDIVRDAILNWSAVDNYNLNSRNCVHFVVDVFASLQITLPQTSGTWPMGGGLNPGNFGQDLRTMALLPNMTRNTAGGDAPMSDCH